MIVINVSGVLLQIIQNVSFYLHTKLFLTLRQQILCKGFMKHEIRNSQGKQFDAKQVTFEIMRKLIFKFM